MEVGPNVERVAVGDIVAVEPTIACWRCVECRRGLYNCCRSYGVLGYSGLSGGLAEFAVVQDWQAHRVPPGIDPEVAALVQPLAVAVHAVRGSGMQVGDDVAVFGAGPVGLGIVAVARAGGAGRILVSEISPARRAMAERLGATTTVDPTSDDPEQTFLGVTSGDGVDVAWEAAGTDPSLESSIRVTRPRGTTVVVAMFRGRSSIALTDLVMKERRLIGTLAYRFDFPATIELIALGKLPGRELVTRRIAMADVVSQGIDRLRGVSEEIKILVRPSG